MSTTSTKGKASEETPSNGRDWQARKDADGQNVIFREEKQWLKHVNGADLLSALEACFTRYVALPPHAAATMALWVVHSFVFDTFQVSPILCVSSPEKRCGKTTALKVFSALCSKSLLLSNLTESSLSRLIDDHAPTLLLDDAHVLLSHSASLCTILSGGHDRSSAFSVRTESKSRTPRRFSTWCPKAIALTGSLPDALADRAITIAMRRKLPTETTLRVPQEGVPGAAEFRAKCTRWLHDIAESLVHSDPLLPAALDDRARDNWRALVAIADAAGGEWPVRARAASQELTPGDDDTRSVAVQLLADVRTIIEKSAATKIPTEVLVESLVSIEGRPWRAWKRSDHVATRELARLLRPLGIEPVRIRVGEKVLRGYERERFADAFARYLPRWEVEVDEM